MASMQEIEAKLIGAGGPFEVVPSDVLGERVHVFKNRMPHLRQVLAGSTAHGDAEFMVWLDRRMTYAQHLASVGSVARALADRYGVRKGDRVAILAENRPEWVISFWAAVSLGAVAVAMNGWWTGDEIEYAIGDSEPKVLIGDRKRLDRLRSDPGIPVVEMETEFEKLAAYDFGAGLPDVPIAEDDPATILYTSGTTGRPKGAVNSHRCVLSSLGMQMFHGARIFLTAAANGAAPAAPANRPCTLVTTPLFHVSGLYSGVVTSVAAGIKTVWRSGRFDAEDVMRLIERERVTSWSAMNTMAYRVVRHPDVDRYDLSSVTNVGSGGAPIARELLERMAEVFPNARGNRGFGYGLTESAGLGTICGGEELEQYPGSVGRALPTVQLEIRGPDGAPLPEGEEGEIHLRGPNIMLGYWRKPQATSDVILPGRWLRTGDIGRLEDGRLYINSRARDLILRGGENIYPAEIELRLEAHPEVEEVAVVGVDHEELGQEVKAIVVPQAGAGIDEAKLAAWVGASLAPFKVPTKWELRSTPLPRNATGKVLKNVLQGEAENPFAGE